MANYKENRLFLKKPYLGKEAGAEAYVAMQVENIIAIRFTDGCSWCQGNKYHLHTTAEEIENLFVIL